MSYFRTNRHKIFPEITDWTDPQDHIRYSKKIKSMDYKHWFYLTPSAYHIISFGINAIASILFGFLSIYSVYRQLWIILAIALIIFASNILAAIKKINNWELIKDQTFYDIWMRDYLPGDDKK